MAIKDGDTVRIEYRGTLEDGTEFDSSEKHGQPLEFKVGEGKVIKGFDAAVKGMEKGEEKDVTIPVDQAYGERDPRLTHKVLKDKLPAEPEPKVGMQLFAQLPTGGQMPAMITDVTDVDVTIDMNHPLAGKVLHFHIKVVDIVSS